MKIIVYTHSDYADIFQLTLHYLQKAPLRDGDLLVFADRRPDLLPPTTQVLLYDNADPYATRLLTCLRQIADPDPYYLLLHDNDLLYHYDPAAFDELANILPIHNIDRLNFAPSNHSCPEHFIRVQPHTIMDFQTTGGEPCKIFKNPRFFAYNVGPGIWRTDAWMDILGRFPEATYRTIEETSDYVADNYNVYNIQCRASLRLFPPVFALFFRLSPHNHAGSVY